MQPTELVSLSPDWSRWGGGRAGLLLLALTGGPLGALGKVMLEGGKPSSNWGISYVMPGFEPCTRSCSPIPTLACLGSG